MNVRIQMIDIETGEILCIRYYNYALNFNTKNDAGFVTIQRWIQSSVRGVRIAKHKCIELRVSFSDEKEELFLPFGMTKEDVNINAANYVY